MDEPTLDQRIARLERLVDELHRRSTAPVHDTAASDRESQSATDSLAMQPGVRNPRSGVEAPGFKERREGGSHPAADWRRWLWDSELWLNKLGVGLVLFGITFLFKYSIDQGWLTPEVRVGFGLLVGAAMLAVGLRLPQRQQGLAQVLLGGGIAVFYIVGFAAYQMYHLVGYNLAFAFMAGVTVLAFGLAVQRDNPVLSLIGVKGALGTPFLLFSGDGDFPWLVSYTCLVVAAAVALHFSRGWRSVLWTAFAGGWTVLGVAFWLSVVDLPLEVSADRWLLQGAALFFGVLFAAAALFDGSRAGWSGGPDRSPAPPRYIVLSVYLMVIATPLLAASFTGAIWSLGAVQWGWLVVTVAAAYAAAGGALRRTSALLGAAHLLAAAMLLPLGTAGALSGEWLFVVLAIEGAALLVLSRRLAMRGTEVIAHSIFAALAVWFAVRLGAAGIAGTGRAAADAAVLAVALAGSGQIGLLRERRVYRFAAHGALLALFWRELSNLPHGAAWVSVAWGAYGLALLVSGLRSGVELLQKTALATLVLLVAKLFVVDLAALEAIWRVLLFLGLGSLFLVISYLLQGTWEAQARVRRQSF